MLSWWRQRKERQQQVIRDADNLVAMVSDAIRKLSGEPGMRMLPAAIPATGLPCVGRLPGALEMHIGLDTGRDISAASRSLSPR